MSALTLTELNHGTLTFDNFMNMFQQGLSMQVFFLCDLDWLPIRLAGLS